MVLYRSESLAGFWYLCRSEVLPGEISAFWWVERLRIAATAALPAAPTHRDVKRTNAMSSRQFSTWDENSSFNFWNRQRACGGIPPLFKSVAGNLFLQATPTFKGQLVFFCLQEDLVFYWIAWRLWEIMMGWFCRIEKRWLNPPPYSLGRQPGKSEEKL